MKNSNPVNSDNILRKSGIPIFIITIFLMAVSLICPQWTQGGEIYTYTDKDGVKVITNTPIPEKYQRKAQKIDSYNGRTSSERNTRSKSNDEIEALINRLENDPNSRVTQSMGGGKVKTGGLKKHVLKQIVELRKAQLRSQRNEGNAGKTRNQQDKMEDEVKQQHMNSYTAKDAFGTPVKSDSSHLTRDAFGNIVSSDNPHLTRDAFGTIVNSDNPHLTKDAFGTIIMSK